jgi:hypothetical protein
MGSRSSVALLLTALIGTFPAAIAEAGVYEVVIDTTQALGQAGALSIDLTGNPGLENTATINDFATDGIMRLARTSGGVVAGALILGLNPAPVTTIEDGSFYNRIELPFLGFGTRITFTLSLTENGPPASSPFLQDELSMFMLNDLGGAGLDTSDPLGPEAMAAICIDGTREGLVQVFAPATYDPTGPGGVPRIELVMPTLSGGSAPLVGDPRLKVRLKFAKAQRDAIQLKIKDLALPAGFVAAGADVSTNVGGVVLEATLDPKGRFKSTDKKDSLKLKQDKDGSWTLSMKRKKGNFGADLEDDGLGNETTPKPGKLVALRVMLTAGGEIMSRGGLLTYKSKRDKAGKAN